MNNISALALDRALRAGDVPEPVGILDTTEPHALRGHFVPWQWTGRDGDADDTAMIATGPAYQARPEDLRYAQLAAEIADAHAEIERLRCRLEGRSPRPRSRWATASLRRRSAYAALRDGDLPKPPENPPNEETR